MSISVQSATPILGLVNSAVSVAKSAVELAKKAKDSELKEKVNEVLDGILDIKGTAISLELELHELKVKIAERGTIARDQQYGYWFKEGETEPLCPKCYEGDDKVVYLPPLRSGGRRCRVCDQYYSQGAPNQGTAMSVARSISSQARGYWE